MCAQRREKGRRERQSTAMGGKNLSNKSVYEKERERERAKGKVGVRFASSSLIITPAVRTQLSAAPSLHRRWGGQASRGRGTAHSTTTTLPPRSGLQEGGCSGRRGGALQMVTDFQGGHNTADSVPGVPRLSAVHSEKWISAVSQSMCACILNPNTEHLGLADSN